MEKWIKLKLDEINKLYEEGKVEPLSEFARGMASGIRQTFLWLSDSGTWMDPIETILAWRLMLPGHQFVRIATSEVAFKQLYTKLGGGEG